MAELWEVDHFLLQGILIKYSCIARLFGAARKNHFPRDFHARCKNETRAHRARRDIEDRSRWPVSLPMFPLGHVKRTKRWQTCFSTGCFRVSLRAGDKNRETSQHSTMKAPFNFPRAFFFFFFDKKRFPRSPRGIWLGDSWSKGNRKRKTDRFAKIVEKRIANEVENALDCYCFFSPMILRSFISDFTR